MSNDHEEIMIAIKQHEANTRSSEFRRKTPLFSSVFDNKIDCFFFGTNVTMSDSGTSCMRTSTFVVAKMTVAYTQMIGQSQ